MKRLYKKDYKKGLEVKLTHPHENYSIGPSNPATGTPHECWGKILKIDKFVRVRWSNGNSNSYRDGTLSANVTPPPQGECEDLWETSSKGFM